jgi:acetyltransferase
MGASRKPGKVGHAVVTNLVVEGFQGEIVPVNPSEGELLGQRFYPSLEDYGKPVEMSVITVPRENVIEAVTSSLKAKAKAVVVITAGFKEVDDEGARLEAEIADLCKTAGARLMGPNSLGIINTHHKMNAAFACHTPRPGAISVVSQSGALCSAILDWAAARNVGLATLLSMGNKADLDETDFLAALTDDNKTKVIAGYLESIGSGPDFIRLAEAAASIKPVVVLKAGTTDAGSRAASSHTGALAGADIAYGAAFKRAGVIRADTFESLFDIATAFAMQPLPQGDRVAIITNAGGPGAMAADAIERTGMQVATLDHILATTLQKKLPAAARVGNPIDLLEDADPDRYALAVEAAQSDPNVDAVIAILTPQAVTKPAETALAIAESSKGKKPILAALMGGADISSGQRELVAADVPDYPSPERAVAALKAMVDYATWRNRPRRVVTRFPVNRRRVERIISRQLSAGRTYLGEVRAKDILRAYDFVVPEGQLVSTSEEAMDAASHLGYPLAMKIVSPDIIHKSDVGGVKLNLQTDQEVVDTFELMMVRVARKTPDAFLEGVYLERMVLKGREVILGMTRDPSSVPC